MKKNGLLFLVLSLGLLFAVPGQAAGLNGDFDRDGDVDGHDLTVFSENYGSSELACRENDNCTPDAYCAKPAGACDGPGECREKPEVCYTLYEPVCGCDGRTYTNDCQAAMAGVNVAFSGPCSDKEFTLGEEFKLPVHGVKKNADEKIAIEFVKVIRDNRCPTDASCIWPGNAGAAFVFYKENSAISFILNTGIHPRSIFVFGYAIELKDLFPPVPQDRFSDSEAYVAALLITESQESCYDNLDCPKSGYCAKALGDCQGSGTCQSRPLVCPDVFEPVCGCDEKTYGNKCEAAAEGINVQQAGACRDPRCDDGSPLLCKMMPPVCDKEFEVLAIQDNCWICVNPATCLPWGEPGCSPDAGDCPEGMTCDFCGTSSCPVCDDCVPACVPE